MKITYGTCAMAEGKALVLGPKSRFSGQWMWNLPNHTQKALCLGLWIILVVPLPLPDSSPHLGDSHGDLTSLAGLTMCGLVSLSFPHV